MSNINIPVTVEFSAEDRARLDRLIELLNQITPPTLTMEPMKPAQTAQEHHTAELRAIEVETSEPLPAIPLEDVVPTNATPDESEKAVTSDDIRALVQKLVAPSTGKRDRTKAVVTKYAPTVSEIPADKFGEVFAALKALEVEA